MIGAFDRLTGLSEEAVVRYHRRLEETMVVIRWIAVLHSLLILLLVPPPSWLLALLVTAGLAVGNLALTIYLRRAYRLRCYLIIGGVASGLEWLTAVGMIVAYSTTALDPLPATMIILLVIDGVRYGLGGLIGAGVAAALAVGSAIALQITLLGVLRPTTGMALLVRWEVVIVASAMTVGFFLRIGQEWLHQEQSQ